MPVPSTGPLELRGDINLEINGNTTDTNVGLHQLSLDAGFSTPDAMSDFYGYSSVVAPSVVTKPVSSVGVTNQTLNGCITDNGGVAVTRGHYFGTSTNRTSNTKYAIGGTQNSGNFAQYRSGLSSGTTYYNWAFACNSAGEAVGNRCQAGTSYPPFTPSGFNPASLTGVRYYDWTGECFAGSEYDCAGARMGYINPYSGGGNQRIGVNCNPATFQYSVSSPVASATGAQNYYSFCNRNRKQGCSPPSLSINLISCHYSQSPSRGTYSSISNTDQRFPTGNRRFLGFQCGTASGQTCYWGNARDPYGGYTVANNHYGGYRWTK